MKILLLILLVILSACATRHERMRGSVALKTSDNLGIACIDSDQVKEGMKLFLSNNECRQGADSRGAIPNCSLVKAGMVEITKIQSPHYSEFKTLSDFKFAEGSVIKSTEEIRD